MFPASVILLLCGNSLLFCFLSDFQLSQLGQAKTGFSETGNVYLKNSIVYLIWCVLTMGKNHGLIN